MLENRPVDRVEEINSNPMIQWKPDESKPLDRVSLPLTIGPYDPLIRNVESEEGCHTVIFYTPHPKHECDRLNCKEPAHYIVQVYSYVLTSGNLLGNALAWKCVFHAIEFDRSTNPPNHRRFSDEFIKEVAMKDPRGKKLLEIINKRLVGDLLHNESGNIQLNYNFTNEEWESKLEEIVENDSDNLEKLAQ